MKKKVIVCKIFWPFYQIDTPWSALCFNSELVVLFQVQFWSDTVLKITTNITNVWKYFYVFTKAHILWEGHTNFKKIFLIWHTIILNPIGNRAPIYILIHELKILNISLHELNQNIFMQLNTVRPWDARFFRS